MRHFYNYVIPLIELKVNVMAIKFLKQNYEILPVVSTAVAISQIGGKISLLVVKAFGGSCESFGKFASTFSMIEQKSILSICTMAIPIIGNIAIYLLKKQQPLIQAQPAPAVAEDVLQDREQPAETENVEVPQPAPAVAEDVVQDGEQPAEDAEEGELVGGLIHQASEERLPLVGVQIPYPLDIIDQEAFLLFGTNSQAIQAKASRIYHNHLVPASNLLGKFILESYTGNKKVIHAIVALKGAQIAWTPFINATFSIIKYFPTGLTLASLTTLCIVPIVDGINKHTIAIQNNASEASLRDKFIIIMRNTYLNSSIYGLFLGYTLTNYENLTLIDSSVITLTYLLSLSIIRKGVTPKRVLSMWRLASGLGTSISQKAIIAKDCFKENILPKARSILTYPMNQYDQTSTKTKQIGLGIFVLFTLGMIAYFLHNITPSKPNYPLYFPPILNSTDPSSLSLTA